MGKSKIYTRKGDEGFTSLVGGKRAPKHSPRIDAYGTVDELNSFIACLHEDTDDAGDREFLYNIQSELFNLGGYLASEEKITVCSINNETVKRIEAEMDKIDSALPPVRSFILPGGCQANAFANICRTVCRRTERVMYQLHSIEKIDANALKYINRLSDYFFLLGRKYNLLKNIDEKVWKKPCI
ncbi:MAG: cob(I)yrinic acid a,c-diamide adenosyltransferase [Dysgonamonadaceae bacterium]|jgi:cob(I)alamin adenosyltransferase|nr:cob(I)yrinic acid a,c-diamide adenosyltransferase [Dysgonamonadaceae bacterium]